MCSTANGAGVGDGIFLRAPKLSTTNINEPMFGLSYLFTKISATATTYSLRAVITADIEFYSYDGNGGVLANYDRN